MTMQMQEGVYYLPGTKPGKFFLIAFLSSAPEATANTAHAFLRDLWIVYQNLKKGEVGDLPGITVPHGNLTVLMGYGPNTFKIPGTKNIPTELGPSNRFLAPKTSGGGRLLPNSGLSFADHINKNSATEAVALQFIADTQLAVNRALVETWKFIFDKESNGVAPVPFTLASFFSGFQRDDHRSWIDFHDGISNLRSGVERENAIRIKVGPYEFGTYLSFLRLPVNLSSWRRLGRKPQELLVGRDKLSGCPLIDIGTEGSPITVAGCPVTGSSQVTDEGNAQFHEPPLVGNAVLRQSHVQRANLQHSQNTADPQSLRIFRQGYEFLEPAGGPLGFKAGLNFVSFQDTPRRVIRLLTRQGWLGNINFGGDPLNPLPGMDKLLTVEAAGNFLVPPLLDLEEFPGASLFLH